MRTYDMGSALDGMRQTAKRKGKDGQRDTKFTGLLHHVYAIERLQAAYLAVKRDAAPGMDGVTWQQYGQDLQGNLHDLSDRLARGGYRPQPVKRVYITEADGTKRHPTVGRLRLRGIPALEDKIVQRATVEVLNAIYEQDFLGLSYGFRPERSAHDALDAVSVGIWSQRVNLAYPVVTDSTLCRSDAMQGFQSRRQAIYSCNPRQSVTAKTRRVRRAYGPTMHLVRTCL